MRGAVTVIQAILIMLVIVSAIVVLIPWIAESLDRSAQIAEMESVSNQLLLCNEKIEETARVGSSNVCIFSATKGKMYAETDGIYYEIISPVDICDESDWSLISSDDHLYQKCDEVDDKSIYTLKWSWPQELTIYGENVSGNIYRLEDPISSISFNDTVNFRTLTVFIEFEFTPGQSGNVIEMTRVSVDDEKVTLRVNIK